MPKANIEALLSVSPQRRLHKGTAENRDGYCSITAISHDETATAPPRRACGLKAASPFSRTRNNVAMALCPFALPCAREDIGRVLWCVETQRQTLFTPLCSFFSLCERARATHAERRYKFARSGKFLPNGQAKYRTKYTTLLHLLDVPPRARNANGQVVVTQLHPRPGPTCWRLQGPPPCRTSRAVPARPRSCVRGARRARGPPSQRCR